MHAHAYPCMLMLAQPTSSTSQSMSFACRPIVHGTLYMARVVCLPVIAALARVRSSGLRELIQWSGVHRAVAPSKPSVALKPSVKPAAKPAPPRGAGKGKESRGARHFYLVVVRVRREDFVRSCAFGSCLLYRSLRAFALANALVHSIAALEEELTLTLCVPIRAP